MIQSLCACTAHSLLRYLRTDWINWAFVSAMKTEKLKSIFSSCFSARGFGHVCVVVVVFFSSHGISFGQLIFKKQFLSRMKMAFVVFLCCGLFATMPSASHSWNCVLLFLCVYRLPLDRPPSVESEYTDTRTRGAPVLVRGLLRYFSAWCLPRAFAYP